ncbi:MAG: hypothetical protein AAF889_06130 [Cyanobacteria bacterium P01_D01_bin.73]
MEPLTVVWRYGDSDPANPAHFETISQWWARLNGQTITWRQRLMDQTPDPRQLDWEVERFDEQFVCQGAEVRGISLYWHKVGQEAERNSTPAKLELDTLHQHLYIYPKSQPDLVIRVGLPEVTYQTLSVAASQCEVAAKAGGYQLSVLDKTQGLQVNIALSAEQAAALKQQLP